MAIKLYICLHILFLSFYNSSPTTPDSPSLRILPTLEEGDSSPQTNPTLAAPPPKKACTLPARVDASEIMNFTSLDGRHAQSQNHTQNHTQNHNATHYQSSGSRKYSSTSPTSNGYIAQNGLVDNFDCINELLDEGLESSNSQRRERTATGRETDRRRVFPSRENYNPGYTNRSYTLQK